MTAFPPSWRNAGRTPMNPPYHYHTLRAREQSRRDREKWLKRALWLALASSIGFCAFKWCWLAALFTN